MTKRNRDDKSSKSSKSSKSDKSDKSSKSGSQSQSQSQQEKKKKKPKHEKEQSGAKMQVQLGEGGGGGGGGGGSHPHLPSLLSRGGGGGSHSLLPPLFSRGVSGDSLDGGGGGGESYPQLTPLFFRGGSSLPPMNPLLPLSSGSIPRSVIPPEKVELLNKYFNLREIKAFVELYNALLLSTSSKNITRKMVKERMQSIQQVEATDLKKRENDQHETFYTVSVTGISEDDVIHFLYWKYGCIPPDTKKPIRLFLKNFKINSNPNKEKHTIYIRDTWLTALENALKLHLQNKFMEQVHKEAQHAQAPPPQTKRMLQLLPFLRQVKQDNLKDLRQFLHGSYKNKSTTDFLIEKYHWKSEKPDQKHLAQAAARQAKSKQQKQQKQRQLTCEVVVNQETGELCGLPVFIWNPIDHRS